MVRDGATDYLEQLQSMVNVFEPVVGRFAAALRRLHATRIIDLCAGGAGPWAQLLPALRAEGISSEVVLTDLYPNAEAFARAERTLGGVVGLRTPVDATRVPPEVQGFRTLFNAFHHFRPEQAKAILRDAVERREGIAIFETVERTPKAIASIVPTPLLVMALTPLMRPFRWSRLLFTYVLPLIPFIGLFDGIVSCLRVYSPDELRALVGELGETGYDWEIGHAQGKHPMRMTYLIGTPRIG